MMFKHLIIYFSFLFIPTMALGEAESAEYRYLTESFSKYGAAVERCERLGDKRALPDDKTLAALDSYDIDQTRVFLVGREYYLSDQCAKDELLALLLAVMSLESVELQPATKQVLQGIRDMLFTGTRWQLEKQYRALPAQMKEDLKALPYFRAPFDSLTILDQLER